MQLFQKDLTDVNVSHTYVYFSNCLLPISTFYIPFFAYKLGLQAIWLRCEMMEPYFIDCHIWTQYVEFVTIVDKIWSLRYTKILSYTNFQVAESNRPIGKLIFNNWPTIFFLNIVYVALGHSFGELRVYIRLSFFQSSVTSALLNLQHSLSEWNNNKIATTSIASKSTMCFICNMCNSNIL